MREIVSSKKLSVTGSTSYGTAYVIVYKDEDGNLIKAPACPEGINRGRIG